MRLTNGCVCCSLADGFLDTLMRVLAEPEPFDHMVIEARRRRRSRRHRGDRPG
ncbi:GTP-binding protein [Methylobacterium oryzae CBMB20]